MKQHMLTFSAKFLSKYWSDFYQIRHICYLQYFIYLKKNSYWYLKKCSLNNFLKNEFTVIDTEYWNPKRFIFPFRRLRGNNFIFKNSEKTPWNEQWGQLPVPPPLDPPLGENKRGLAYKEDLEIKRKKRSGIKSI